MKGHLKNILIVTHAGKGGIPVYLSDLKNSLKTEFNLYVLSCLWGKIAILEYDENNLHKKIYYEINQPINKYDLSNPDYEKLVSYILTSFHIDIVHINSTIWHTFDIFTVPKKFGIPVILTVHDFY